MTHLLDWRPYGMLVTPNAGENGEQQKFSAVGMHFAVMQTGILTRKQSLSCYPAFMLFDTYPKELKTYFHSKIYTQMFMAALVLIAKIWKNQNVLQ